MVRRFTSHSKSSDEKFQAQEPIFFEFQFKSGLDSCGERCTCFGLGLEERAIAGSTKPKEGRRAHDFLLFLISASS